MREVHYCACGDHAFASLTKGFMAMVSPEDANVLTEHWRAHVTRRWRRKYVTILSPSGGKYILARVIMNAAPGQKVDHRSGQTMDNRRSNLRLCTHTDNMQNIAGPRGQAKPVGVRREGKRYSAEITCHGVRHRLGTFGSVVEAAEAYRRAAAELRGDFARVA